MSKPSPTFEIHVHGDVQLRAGVTYEEVQEALRPLWQYVGAATLKAAADSSFDEEPGISYDKRRVCSRCAGLCRAAMIFATHSTSCAWA